LNKNENPRESSLGDFFEFSPAIARTGFFKWDTVLPASVFVHPAKTACRLREVIKTGNFLTAVGTIWSPKKSYNYIIARILKIKFYSKE